MQFSRLFGRGTEADGVISGSVRVDASPMQLARRLRKGDVAIIDVMDLDQRTAEAIAEAQPAAVLNAKESISGRYPNGGPQVLVDAAIPLVDQLGHDLLTLRDGAKVRIEGPDVYSGDKQIATGLIQTAASVASAMEQAGEGMNVQLATFTANAMEHVAHDAPLLLEGKGLPPTKVKFRGQQVLIVAAGFGHEDQLKSIRAYLRDRRPVIIAVSNGADAVIKHAYPPAIIMGTVESVSDEALTSGAELVLHDPTGGDAGVSRADSLNVEHIKSDASVASADLAILMAHGGGATVIATVGIEARLLDFLEQGQNATASTFLARLIAGGVLVDATTLTKVYRHRYSPWTLVALVLSALFVLGNALALTPGGAAWLRSIWPSVSSLFGATA